MKGFRVENGFMNTQKTLPTEASVQDFLDAASPTKRSQDGHTLDRVFREATGEQPVMWGPSIVGYGQYNYGSPVNPKTRGIWPKTGFSPRKTQLSLYGLKDTEQGAALLSSLGKYTEGAGCIYVKKVEDIDLEVLRELIALASQRVDDW